MRWEQWKQLSKNDKEEYRNTFLKEAMMYCFISLFCMFFILGIAIYEAIITGTNPISLICMLGLPVLVCLVGLARVDGQIDEWLRGKLK